MIICKYYDLKYEEINGFWKKRENFANSNVIKNSFIVLKDVLSKQQEIHRNTSHPVLKDFIKGIALANKNK